MYQQTFSPSLSSFAVYSEQYGLIGHVNAKSIRQAVKVFKIHHPQFKKSQLYARKEKK